MRRCIMCTLYNLQCTMCTCVLCTQPKRPVDPKKSINETNGRMSRQKKEEQFEQNEQKRRNAPRKRSNVDSMHLSHLLLLFIHNSQIFSFLFWIFFSTIPTNHWWPLHKISSFVLQFFFVFSAKTKIRSVYTISNCGAATVATLTHLHKCAETHRPHCCWFDFVRSHLLLVLQTKRILFTRCMNPHTHTNVLHIRSFIRSHIHKSNRTTQSTHTAIWKHAHILDSHIQSQRHNTDSGTVFASWAEQQTAALQYSVNCCMAQFI